MRIDSSRLPSMTPARDSSNERTRYQSMQNESNKYRKYVFPNICSEQVPGLFQVRVRALPARLSYPLQVWDGAGPGPEILPPSPSPPPPSQGQKENLIVSQISGRTHPLKINPRRLKIKKLVSSESVTFIANKQ